MISHAPALPGRAGTPVSCMLRMRKGRESAAHAREAGYVYRNACCAVMGVDGFSGSFRLGFGRASQNRRKKKDQTQDSKKLSSTSTVRCRARVSTFHVVFI